METRNSGFFSGGRRVKKDRFMKFMGLLIVIMFPNLVLAQYPNIRVSQVGSIDPEEVTISINPTNPLNLAAGANINYYYYSMDGVLTWTEGRLTSTLGIWGDPSVIFDAQGNLYFGHLSNPDVGHLADRIVVQKSTDGGITWNDGAGIGLNPPKVEDKEWLATDQTNSPYRDNIYVAWTEFDEIWSADPMDSTRILFSRSTDHGETWSDPLRVSDFGGNCLDGDSTVEGAVPAVGPHGEVYTSWAGPLGIMFDKSLDGGLTWGTDIFVTDQPGGWAFDIPGIFRCNGMPVTACDISDSPYQGNIYVLWSDQRNGLDDTDVFLKKSTDGGDTWSEIKRVNDDATAAHQFFPWMAIDPLTGIIWVVFYDRRNTAGDATEVYVARSEDGGETFVNFPVSDSAFTPYSWIFFGDYINISARGGQVYPIWTRMDGGNLSVWVALIDEIVGVDIAEGIDLPDDFRLSQNYPNPFNPATTISFELPQSAMVILSVYNIRGQLVKTLVEEWRDAGSHAVNWEASGLSSGVYLYKIVAGSYSAAKKCLLVR
jgi:hypothetical protein